MITIDLTVRPGGFYSGCHVVSKGKKHFLATKEDSASVIVSSNVDKWLRSQPSDKEVVLTGSTPNAIMLSVYELIRSKETFDWIYLSNQRIEMLPIKRLEPPRDFRSDIH